MPRVLLVPNAEGPVQGPGSKALGFITKPQPGPSKRGDQGQQPRSEASQVSGYRVQCPEAQIMAMSNIGNDYLCYFGGSV